MPIFQAPGPQTPGQRLFSGIAVAAAFAGCCVVGICEARSCARIPYGYETGHNYVAALLAAIAIGLGGICLCIYWRTRLLGISLVVSGMLSYGVFLGGIAYLSSRNLVAWRQPLSLANSAPQQKFSLVIYFRKGTTDQEIGDFVESVIKRPGQPMHPEPEYPWFILRDVALSPDQANGFKARAENFRETAPGSVTGPYIADIRSDRRVEKVFLNASPSDVHVAAGQP
jgi:hypothetical protein